MNRGFLAAVLLATTLAATGETADRLKFGWPENLQARVEVRIRGTRHVPGEPKHEWDVSATYDLVTESVGDRVLIHRRNFDGWHGSMPSTVTWIGEQIVDRVPTLIVSRQGEFLGIEGVEAARRAIWDSAKVFGGVPQGQEPLLEAATTAEGLTAMSKEFWTLAVQNWLVMALKEGESRRLKSRASVPQLGGGTLDFDVEIENRGMRMCPVEGCGVPCLEFILRSQPNREQVERALSKWSGPFRFRSLKQDAKVIILLDPWTMLPHHIDKLRDARQEIVADERGASLLGGEVCQRLYSFHYKQSTE